MLAWLHIGIIVVTVCVVLYADHHAFRYLLGRERALDKSTTLRLHYTVWALLAGMLITGTALVWQGWAYYFSIPEFKLKLFFVAVLVVNSFVITSIMHAAFETPFAELPRSRQASFLLSGAVSTLGWAGAIATALYLFW